ncbi:MAG: DALR anticodon-binding domain-containing protein [Prochloraceae cyanobacterium]
MEFNVSKNTDSCQLFQVSIPLETLSIQQILTQNIQKSTLNFLPNSSLSAVPLYRLNDTDSIIYRCPIALSLAKTTDLPSTSIAFGIVKCLCQLKTSSQLELEFSIQRVDRGWIDFYLSDRSLALWLEQILQNTSIPTSYPPVSTTDLPSSNVFPLQYAHARCQSLLRLAKETGSIDIEAQSFNESKDLLLLHPAQRNLIFQLLELADTKVSNRSQNWVKLAEQTSQAFLELHRQCPIWEKNNPDFPRSARVKLKLIKITQYFLNWLLVEKIGVTAPNEL